MFDPSRANPKPGHDRLNNYRVTQSDRIFAIIRGPRALPNQQRSVLHPKQSLQKLIGTWSSPHRTRNTRKDRVYFTRKPRFRLLTLKQQAFIGYGRTSIKKARPTYLASQPCKDRVAQEHLREVYIALLKNTVSVALGSLGLAGKRQREQGVMVI